MEKLREEVKAVSFIQEQIELEKKYLLLNDVQREILDILLTKEKQFTSYYLRITIYKKLILDSWLEQLKVAVRDPTNKNHELIKKIPYFGTTQYEEDFIRDMKHILKLKDDELDLVLTNKKPRIVDIEEDLRLAAKNLGIRLPSNKKFNDGLKQLTNKKELGWVAIKKSNGKTEYVIDPDFYGEWKQIRGNLKEAIKREIILKETLTPLSFKFWKIP